MLSAYCGHLEVVKAIVERINDIEFLDEPGNRILEPQSFFLMETLNHRTSFQLSD